MNLLFKDLKEENSQTTTDACGVTIKSLSVYLGKLKLKIVKSLYLGNFLFQSKPLCFNFIQSLFIIILVDSVIYIMNSYMSILVLQVK